MTTVIRASVKNQTKGFKKSGFPKNGWTPESEEKPKRFADLLAMSQPVTMREMAIADCRYALNLAEKLGDGRDYGGKYFRDNLPVALRQHFDIWLSSDVDKADDLEYRTVIVEIFEKLNQINCLLRKS